MTPATMITPTQTSAAADSAALSISPSARPLSLEMVELELALDIGDIRSLGFSFAVRQAIESLDGEFLFDLPASGLSDTDQRIAVVRLGQPGEDQLLLVSLDQDGEQLKVGVPDERTAGLADFARAFIDVLEKL
ncbi:hypothetical protein DFR52_102578 [Hoeflea marina]|uniref:Uncharacterized protein n=1 Tax=Hoeflea marina TaxID=274592 RepID=A0A317PSW3_9HYPH|nr:hypothetical protein [Hoeflea marina]PWW01914.1 hypothetical protein DFR52_102578 [Hoeflea marina]